MSMHQDFLKKEISRVNQELTMYQSLINQLEQSLKRSPRNRRAEHVQFNGLKANRFRLKEELKGLEKQVF